MSVMTRTRDKEKNWVPLIWVDPNIAFRTAGRCSNHWATGRLVWRTAWVIYFLDKMFNRVQYQTNRKRLISLEHEYQHTIESFTLGFVACLLSDKKSLLMRVSVFPSFDLSCLPFFENNSSWKQKHHHSEIGRVSCRPCVWFNKNRYTTCTCASTVVDHWNLQITQYIRVTYISMGQLPLPSIYLTALYFL